jgi:uncharacterized protein YqjF (DUF2071 family)
MNGPPIFEVDVLNFALVTFEVPAYRLSRLLPEAYELDTFDGPHGETGFVSTTCFCNQDFSPFGISYPKHTFNESTYRTYVTRDGAKGVYFFGRYLGTKIAWVLQRPLARHTYEADFDLTIDRQLKGYTTYSCSAASSSGNTEFSLRALDPPETRSPFRSSDELTQFLTYRLHGYFTSSAGLQGHMPVSHPRMDPLAGQLLSGRFDLWDRLGVLSPEECTHPYSVLVVPNVRFQLFAPRPAGNS